LPSLLLVVIAPDRSGLLQHHGVRPFLAWLLLSGMLLCRNATLALLPAVFVLYVGLRSELALRRRIATAAALILASLLPWYGVLRFLGQLSERGGSQHGLVEYSRQALSGLAYAFGPQRGCVGALLLCGLALTLLGERRRELVALMTFTALGMAGLVLLFSATYVAEPLAGRFVVFAAISFTLVSLAAWQPPARGWRQRAQGILGVLVTAVALYRVGVKSRLAGMEQPVTALDVTLSSSYWKGPPQTRGGYVLVAPPSYPFLTREPPP
jgi:hypothetical protein